MSVNSTDQRTSYLFCSLSVRARPGRTAQTSMSLDGIFMHVWPLVLCTGSEIYQHTAHIHGASQTLLTWQMISRPCPHAKSKQKSVASKEDARSLRRMPKSPILSPLQNLANLSDAGRMIRSWRRLCSECLKRLVT